ncbi:MAG: glycoside hydrolase family 20 zincin-like fold domain-containing protein, partial [Pseudonocardiaceae bacterium]
MHFGVLTQQSWAVSGHCGRRAIVAVAVAGVLVPLGIGPGVAAAQPRPAAAPAPAKAPAPKLIPEPASMQTTPGAHFTLTRRTKILVPRGSSKADAVGTFLAHALRPSTGYPLPVVTTTGHGSTGDITLEVGRSAAVGREGYRLDVTGDGVRLRARSPEALFDGVQTIRQLLPAQIESSTTQQGPWTMPGVRIADHARFAWRGAMLDVARHFFTVQQVKQY